MVAFMLRNEAEVIKQSIFRPPIPKLRKNVQGGGVGAPGALVFSPHAGELADAVKHMCLAWFVF